MTPQNYLLHVFLVHLVGLYCSANGQDSMSGYTQTIDLRNFPKGYYLNSHRDGPSNPRSMTWTLIGPPRSRLEISCSISLLKRAGCSEGFLSIWGIGRRRVSLCSEIPSYSRKSFGNQIFVEYSTGRNNLGHFKCHVQVMRRAWLTPPAWNTFHVGSSSTQQYHGAQKTSCPCGQSNRRRILGGQETGTNEYPFAVYLKTTGQIHGFCGGSIITQRHVLTAAHCILKRKREEMQVVAGGHHVLLDKKSPGVKTFNIHSIIIPGKIDGKLNDIAILYLSEKIVFNDYVQPVCLPTQRYPLVGQMITALGWGRLGFDGKLSATLQSAELRVVDLKRCSDHYNYLQISLDNPMFLCTYTQCYKDTCKGDSGGPMVYWDLELNSWVQVALITFGETDGKDGPSGHTLIYSYFDWIQRVIDPNWYMRMVAATAALHQGMTVNNRPYYVTCEKLEVLL